MLVGGPVTEIALWGRRQQARASSQQGYLDGALSTSATVGAGRSSTKSLLDHVCEQIVDVLGIHRCRFDPGSNAILATIHNDETMTYNGPFDVDRLGLPTDPEIALVVQSGGVVHGRFLLTAATRIVRPTLEQLRVAVALANQVGAPPLTTSDLGRHPPRTEPNHQPHLGDFII
jgi:hypothetical protein